MPKSKKPVQRGRPRRIALTFAKKVPTQELTAPASLPLSEAVEPAQTTSIPPTDLMTRDNGRYKAVLRALALRAAGLNEDEIASEMGLKKGTIQSYIYLAGKNGLLTLDDAPDPKDQIEYKLLHKVVRNLDESLDSKDQAVRDRATDKLFDAALAPRWAIASAITSPQTLVAIRIEHPPGEPQVMREGTTGGVSAYIDADVLKP